MANELVGFTVGQTIQGSWLTKVLFDFRSATAELMRLFSAPGDRTTMKCRGIVTAVIVMSASVLLLASFASGAPVEGSLRLINKGLQLSVVTFW